MKFEVPNSLEAKIVDHARAAGLSVEDFLRKAIIEKIESVEENIAAVEAITSASRSLSREEILKIVMKGDYPNDEEIARAVAEDPDAPPLLDYETMKQNYKPMPPLKRV